MSRGVIAGVALVAALLGGCGANHADPVEHPAKPIAAVVTTEPVEKLWTWPCDLPMVLTPMAGPGVTDEQIRTELAHPVETLTALGYDVTVGESAPYRSDVQPAERPGEVIIVATDRAADQPELDGAAARTLPNEGDDATVTTAATIVVNADPKVGELSANVLTHELGHVLGLDHRAGSVMDVTWDIPDTFDAAEVAQVACR